MVGDAARDILRFSLMPVTESAKALVKLLEGKQKKMSTLAESGSDRAEEARKVAERSIDERHDLALDVQKTMVA